MKASIPIISVAVMALSSCAGLPPSSLSRETAATANQKANTISEKPVFAITNFTEGLRCVDNMMIDYGIRKLSIIVEDLDDATKKVAAGSKDMLISAISAATKRSRAIRLVAYGNDARNTATFMDRAQRTTQYQAIPDFSIRGSISQFDDNVAKRTADAGFSIGAWLSGGVGASASAKVLGLDLAVIRTEDFSVVNGVNSKNAVVLLSSGMGADASAAVKKFGATYETNTSISESTAVGLRNLVELATIELIGKLNKIPYWRCIGVKDAAEEVRSEIGDWLEGMIQSEQSYEGLAQPVRSSELFSYLQTQMATLGLYDGRTDGLPNKQFGDMLSVYRTMLGLPAGTDVDQEVLEAHFSADRYQLREKIRKYVADNPKDVGRVDQTETAGGPQVHAAETPGTAPADRLIRLGFNLAESVRHKPGEIVDLRLISDAPAMVYCFMKDESGSIMRLFPNSAARNVQANPGRPLPLNGQFGKNRWQIIAATSGKPETVACFASIKNLTARLPALLQGGDFEAINNVNQIEELRSALKQVAGLPFGEAYYTIQSRQ